MANVSTPEGMLELKKNQSISLPEGKEVPVALINTLITVFDTIRYRPGTEETVRIPITIARSDTGYAKIKLTWTKDFDQRTVLGSNGAHNVYFITPESLAGILKVVADKRDEIVQGSSSAEKEKARLRNLNNPHEVMREKRNSSGFAFEPKKGDSGRGV